MLPALFKIIFFLCVCECLFILKVHERERNYTVCYVAFTFFMAGTILVATKLPFDYSSDESVVQQQAASTVMTPEQALVYSHRHC